MDLICEKCDRPIIGNETENIKSILLILLIWMKLIKY